MNGIRLGCWRDGLPYGPPALSILGRFLDFILPILRQKTTILAADMPEMNLWMDSCTSFASCLRYVGAVFFVLAAAASTETDRKRQWVMVGC